MSEIDPDRMPLSVEELQRDALATGADPDAPPLVEAPETSSGGGADKVAEDVTLLPPE